MAKKSRVEVLVVDRIKALDVEMEDYSRKHHAAATERSALQGILEAAASEPGGSNGVEE